MENFKKIFFSYLIIALVGCSSKDDADLEETDPREAYFLEAIVGSWAYDTVKVNGQLFQYQHTEDCVKDLFQFYNTEGKEFDFEESVVLNCNNCAECATGATNLRWELKSDKINLYFGEPLVLVYKIIDVDSEKFTYEVEVDYDEDGDLDFLEITGIPYDPYGVFD